MNTHILPTVMYRLNYGNGQVHGLYPTLNQALHAYRNDQETQRSGNQPFYTYVQEYVGNGRWVRVGGLEVGVDV